MQAVRKEGRIMAGVAMTVYLLVLAVDDMIKKSLNVYLLALGIIPTILTFFENEKPTLTERLLGLLPGLVMLLISVLSKEKIGKGDGLLFCITGVALGIVGNCILLGAALFLIVLYSIAMLARGRLTKHSAVAFIPFVFIGYLIMESMVKW